MTSLAALAATMGLDAEEVDAAMGNEDDPEAALIALMAP